MPLTEVQDTQCRPGERPIACGTAAVLPRGCSQRRQAVAVQVPLPRQGEAACRWASGLDVTSPRREGTGAGARTVSQRQRSSGTGSRRRSERPGQRCQHALSQWRESGTASKAHVWVAHHAERCPPPPGGQPVSLAWRRVPSPRFTAPELLATHPQDRAARGARHGASRIASSVSGVSLWRRDRPVRARPSPRSAGRAYAASRPRIKPLSARKRCPRCFGPSIGTTRLAIARPELALWLLARTFVRTGELIGAKWSEFDLEGEYPVWVVPAERMKMRTEHVVPLARQVIKVLGELRTLAGLSRLRAAGPQSGKADQQQHHAVRPVPPWLQTQHDWSWLSSDRLDHAQRGRFSKRCDRAPTRPLRAQ